MCHLHGGLEALVIDTTVQYIFYSKTSIKLMFQIPNLLSRNGCSLQAVCKTVQRAIILREQADLLSAGNSFRERITDVYKVGLVILG